MGVQLVPFSKSKRKFRIMTIETGKTLPFNEAQVREIMRNYPTLCN